MLFALILFAVTYNAMLLLPKWRWCVALGAAVIFLLAGVLTPVQALGAVDWNIILMLFGTMGIVELFIDSQMPKLLSELLLCHVRDARWAAVVLGLFAGVISAFVDNVATVLMVAPVGLAVAKQLKISPVPLVVAIAVSSNLQGAATLVGDTTSILLASYGGMNFFDFFWMNGRLGIFWAVELGALATIPVFLVLFRKDREPVHARVETKVTDYGPTVLLCAVMLGLILLSFIPNKPAISNGLWCTLLLALGLVRSALREKPAAAADILKRVDYCTLALLAGLFIVISGITEAGVIDAASELFLKIAGRNVFGIYTLLVAVSVLLSAFVDNIPYVATMLPVVTGIANLLGIEPYVLYFGLLTGATLGGNLTPIGASANIAGIGILQKAGYEVKTRDFLRIGVPFTLVAVLAGYLFLWIVWGH